MEWLTGLALLPALVCGVMMGGMALAGVLGWRRSQASTNPEATNTEATTTATDTPRDNTATEDRSPTLEDVRR